MRKAEKRVREEGKVLSDYATPMVSEEITAVETKTGVRPRSINMVIPILVMVLMMPVVLTYTGWEAAVEEFPEAGFFRLITAAMGQGSGSTAVLLSVITAILVSVILYASQRMFTVSEYVYLTMKGISGMMPLALLMLLAFAISAVCRELHTGQYVADITSAWLSPSLLPFLVFLSSCIIAFSTGTSWGTFGIMLAIAIPMAEQLQADPVIVIAAVMSGGVFGDHCSPISDTTIIASMAAATDHIDHVRTQLPYALLAGGLSGLAFLLTGILT
jgi:Na+/H+ antiporter NhaC